MSTSGSSDQDEILQDLVFIKMQLRSMELASKQAAAQAHKKPEDNALLDVAEPVIRATLYVSLDNIQSLIETTLSLVDAFITEQMKRPKEKGGKPS